MSFQDFNINALRKMLHSIPSSEFWSNTSVEDCSAPTLERFSWIHSMTNMVLDKEKTVDLPKLFTLWAQDELYLIYMIGLVPIENPYDAFLWIRDVAEGQIDDPHFNVPTPKERLLALCDYLEKIYVENPDTPQGHYYELHVKYFQEKHVYDWPHGN